MVDILAHRGLWKKNHEKNSIIAFKRAFDNEFGVETDVRDFKDEIVISHDIPSKNSKKLEELLTTLESYSGDFKLALNVKSDGLSINLKRLIMSYNIQNYFFFDMSVPDHLNFIDQDLNTFSRVSEYENSHLLNSKVQGIWLDSFNSDWYNNESIQNLCSKDNEICIVSPELHGRNHIPLWTMIREVSYIINNNISICTDFPIKAKEFFND